MALIYKSVIEWKSGIKELLQSDLKDWAGQLKVELSWPNTELITPDLNVSLHELIDNDASFTELVVSGPAHQDRRTSILIYESTAKSVVCIEEVENKSLKLELPEPSQLVQRVLASMPPVVNNLIVADIQRKPLVALIGDINDFGVLIDDMKRRIGHMANIVVLQESRVPSQWNHESDIRKGSLIWSPTGTHVDLNLPAQMVKNNPISAIRRIHAEVLQIRSVEFAGKYRVPTRVLSSLTDPNIPLDEEMRSGTLITFEEDEKMEAAVVSGIAFSRDEAKVTLLGVPDKPGIAFAILGQVADANIDVDMIVQNQSVDGTTDFSFTVHRNEFARTLAVIKDKIAPSVRPREVLSDDKVAKVSIVGIGMRSHAGVASLMFKTLAQENINIHMISTSEIKTSVVISDKYMELAVRALHKAFGLETVPAKKA